MALPGLILRNVELIYRPSAGYDPPLSRWVICRVLSDGLYAGTGPVDCGSIRCPAEATVSGYFLIPSCARTRGVKTDNCPLADCIYLF